MIIFFIDSNNISSYSLYSNPKLIPNIIEAAIASNNENTYYIPWMNDKNLKIIFIYINYN